MLTYPNFDPVLLQIGPVALHWYGVMYLLGFLAALGLMRHRAKRLKVFSLKEVDDILFYSVLGVVIGGRIGYMFFYAGGDLLTNPLSMLKIWQGGMSFHGGLLGVLGAMWLFAKRRGRSFFEVMDFIAPVVPPGLMFGRIGNFINGELWGKPTDVAWSFMVDGVARHASQLYEAALEGGVLFILLWFYSATKPPLRAVSGLFLMGYGLARFAVEFVRLPDADIGYLAWDWLTMGQVLSLPMILLGAWLMWKAYR